eukprot:c39682_g1_i1.p1 GENE.c39682_g1_i1~~c39682_g1_i1.p1  ORF type:complete len:170 (+),score=30.02 c39682_g1_i1:36-545(+)
MSDKGEAQRKDAPAPAPEQPTIEIDREKTCPLLLRVFVQVGKHHRPEEFENLEEKLKKKLLDEICIHTWKDATLREITDLIKEVNFDAKNPRARLSFALVYPNTRGILKMRPIGECSSSPTRQPTQTENKTLEELKFQTGDYMDISIQRNQPKPYDRPMRGGGPRRDPR